MGKNNSFEWYVDGMNLYAYVNGNVVNMVDPMGTKSVWKMDDEGKIQRKYQGKEGKGHINLDAFNEIVDENVADEFDERFKSEIFQATDMHPYGGLSDVELHLAHERGYIKTGDMPLIYTRDEEGDAVLGKTLEQGLVDVSIELSVAALMGLGEFASSSRSIGANSGVMNQSDDIFQKSTKNSLWQSRPPGVQVRKIGGYWVKRVDPNASKLMQKWGEKSMEAQFEALQKLDDMATPAWMKNGKLITKDVGPTYDDGFRLLNEDVRNLYFDSSKRLGTFLNDVQPRNVGKNNIIFDPAYDPVTKKIVQYGIPASIATGIYIGSKLQE